ncbi:MAG: hypothetical protein ACK52I_17740 [Pseudomonadota bacterium]
MFDAGAWDAMNTLGLTRAGCARALENYQRRVEKLAAVLREPGGEAATQQAEALLEALRFDLEVDVRARATDAGSVRMSRVESETLEPALRQAWLRFERDLAGRASPGWLPALREVGDALAAWRACLDRCDDCTACARGGRTSGRRDALDKSLDA